MKSSSGEHYLALDHVRALAAFMVFCWHFTHAVDGRPAPFGSGLLLPLLDEGHTGVALFMTLSGYLFAKLLDGKHVNYSAFYWNRALRLLPLLAVVALINLAIVIAADKSVVALVRDYAFGVVKPTIPNGGWSITAEFHFYLILPLLLACARRWRFALLAFVLIAVLFRLGLYLGRGEVSYLAYWTIIGRVDQFLLGIFAFQHRGLVAGRPWLVAMAAMGFVGFYAWFDWAGGFYALDGYPSRSPAWILLPTIEGAAYATFIAFYDGREISRSPISLMIGKAGAYSYSIYLLHFLVVFKAAAFIDARVMDLSNFYLAVVWALVCFAALVPVGALSFRFIESPFLKLRRRYIVSSASTLAIEPKPA